MATGPSNMAGLYLFVLMVAVPLALVMSVGVLWLYRRSVRRSMAARSGSAPATATAVDPEEHRASAQPPPQPLEVETRGAQEDVQVSSATGELVRRGRRAAWRAGLVFALAGLVHAAIATVLLFQFNDIELLPRRTLAVWLIFAWPVVPTVVEVTVANRWLKWIGPAAFALVSAVVFPRPLQELAVLWAILAGPPTLILLVLGSRRLRAVGPIALAATMILTLGWMSIAPLQYRLLERDVIRSVGVLRVSRWVMVAVLVALTWLFVRWFAGRYRRKASSDQLLLLDAWWLLFTFWLCAFLSVTGGVLTSFAGLLAFVGYKVVVWTGLRLLGVGRERRPPRRLLLLRVFGHRGRSERLLDELALGWRYVGSLQMIAGTDLAAANLEPHELFDFLNGRLSRRFVKDREDLARRLEGLDLAPDPDGRYRVNEFFCHDDTWRPTLRRLAASSDCVLMDLRGFSPDNRGCVYELEQLVDLVPAARTVLTVDETTDEPFLRATLDEAWNTMSPDSPNRTPDPGPLHLFRIDNQTPGEVRRLFELLANAATAARSALSRRAFMNHPG